VQHWNHRANQEYKSGTQELRKKEDGRFSFSPEFLSSRFFSSDDASELNFLAS